jgi:C-terminal processing protease CtpA/Prc
MRRRQWIWLLVLAVAAGAPLFAGGDSKKCSEDTQTCLNHMVAKLQARGWVGIELDTHAKSAGKLVVTEVEPDSPAMRAGIKPGDVLLAMNGIEFGDEANKKKLHKVKKSMAVGDQVTYTVQRKGKTKDVAVTLGKIPDEIIAKWVGGHMMEHAVIEVASN